MRNFKRHIKKATGDTLIEVLVAMAVAGLMITSLTNIMITNIKSAKTNEARIIASNFAELVLLTGRNTYIDSGEFLWCGQSNNAQVDVSLPTQNTPNTLPTIQTINPITYDGSAQASGGVTLSSPADSYVWGGVTFKALFSLAGPANTLPDCTTGTSPTCAQSSQVRDTAVVSWYIYEKWNYYSVSEIVNRKGC